MKNSIQFKSRGLNVEEYTGLRHHLHEALGRLPTASREHIDVLETARRFTDYLAEFCTFTDYASLLSATFDTHQDGMAPMVVQRNIPFVGMCAHHLLPMYGHAHLGYLPHKTVVGLSKLPRLVDAVGHEKPALQEWYSDRIVNLLMEHLSPIGAVCIIKSTHTCVSCRGTQAVDTDTITSSIRGEFFNDPTIRSEFYQLLNT